MPTSQSTRSENDNFSKKAHFNVALALDGTPHSQSVVSTLSQFCKTTSTNCEMLYVSPRNVSYDKHFEAMDNEAQLETLKVVDETFDNYSKMLSEKGFSVGERHFVRNAEEIEEGILNYIEKDLDCGLLVLGTHDGSLKRQGWRINSTSYAVATHTHKPVMVIKHPPKTHDKLNVLFATDGSEHADQALSRLLRFLPAETATISILNVVSVNTYVLPLVEPFVDYSALEQALTGEAAQMLENTKTVCQRAGFKVAGASFLVGDPAKMILEEASKTQADLVVLGAHGAGGRVTDWLLGSVSSKVLEYCPASVALLR